MKLLVDANLSPVVSKGLRTAGFEADHVADLGLLHATDEAIFDRAVDDGFAVVTADSDFAMLLALRRGTSPSVVQLRHVAELGPEAHLGLLVPNMLAVSDDLEAGAIVSLSPTRLAVRQLPIG